MPRSLVALGFMTNILFYVHYTYNHTGSECLNKWKLLHATKNQELCGASKFHCGDGQCIKDILRCDGYYDCNNFADEQNCGKQPGAIINK